MKRVIIALLLISLLVTSITLIAGESYTAEASVPSVSYTVSPEVNESLQPASTEITGLPVDGDTRNWAFRYMGLDKLEAVAGKGEGVIVAVLDTGVDKNHEDLIGKVVDEIDFTGSGSTDDVYGHGTFVAGVIAANDNLIGITGVAPEVNILNVKVADDSGHCLSDDLAVGIVWAADMNADVINISIQIKDQSVALKEAIEYAWNRGSVIVAAAGNNVVQSYIYPAAYDMVISVAAIDQQGNLAPLSNFGDWVDVAAPGHDIYSLRPGDKYEYETGTSFATAFVSGIAALLSHQVPDTSGNGTCNDEIADLIKSTLIKTSENRINGVVDATGIAGKIVNT